MADDETRDAEQPDEEAAVEPEAQAPDQAPEPEAETPVEPEVATPDEPQAQDEPAVEASDDEVVIEAVVEEDNVIAEVEEDDEPEQPRVKPEIPGADLEVDIVREGVDPLTGEESRSTTRTASRSSDDDAEDDDIVEQPIAAATIDLAAGARYSATGKRKTASPA